MKKIVSGFLDSKWTLSVLSVAILFLTSGFVRAPFPQWALGKVIEINPEQMTLLIQQKGSSKTLFLRWNKKTRLWIEPVSRKDRGAIFDSKALAVGVPVRVMFKKYSDHNRLMRVIRLASAQNAS